MTKAKRVTLYVRVSTDDQTVENQKRELQAWAERCGHGVVKVFEDRGISGSKAVTSGLGSMPCSRRPCVASSICWPSGPRIVSGDHCNT